MNSHTFLAMDTPPLEIASWLGCAYFMLSLILKLLDLRKKLSPPVSQPVEVTAAKEFVSRKEYEELKQEITKDIEGLDNKVDSIKEDMHANHVAILKSVEEHSGDIHTRINGLVLAWAQAQQGGKSK